MPSKTPSPNPIAEVVEAIESNIAEALQEAAEDEVAELEYSSHKEQMLHASPSPERIKEVEAALLAAYSKVITMVSVPVVSFGDLNAEELAEAFFKYPIIIKPTLACVNIAGRAIKRDLGVDIDTYASSITSKQASLLAGYIRPFLPATVAIPALMELDRYFWTDKEMRAKKGQWEKKVVEAMNAATGITLKKRKFTSNGNSYELDAAYPATGDDIEVGIDIKRIEALQDHMKRGDEIINKASKFKNRYPDSIFIAIVYFPFPAQHLNLQTRLHSDDIDYIFFAGESSSSVTSCAELIAGAIRPKKKVSKHVVERSRSITSAPVFMPSLLLASAKRTAVERKGVHAWHPYYAGYSEAFVDSAIDFLKCNANTVILDPWGGSGTTSIVSARRGIASISIDINPAMASFSASKSKDVLVHKTLIEKFFSDALWANALEEPHLENSIGSIYHEETAKLIQAIINSIPYPANSQENLQNYSKPTLEAIHDPSYILNPVHSFFMAVLFSTLRKATGTEKLANPTWLRVSEEKLKLDAAELHQELIRTAQEMLTALEKFYSSHSTAASFMSVPADVRCMPINSASIDRVITSPPYLTRIDYAVSTTPELSLFGDNELIKHVRHKTIGAPVITKNHKEQRPEWGRICNDILNGIASHAGKASKSYYWKNITQYFMDIDDALTEMSRVLKKDGTALVVVQSSYFKEIEIPLGEIYVEMAREKGFDASIAYRQEVKGHMAHVNTRSNIYKANKVYFEDAVHLVKK